MSRRVCYLARAQGGERLCEVRLVGEGSEDSHALDGNWSDASAARAQVQVAAEWIAQRLLQGEGARAGLRMICVDVEGARCSWLSAPGVEESVVAGALSMSDAWGEGGSSASLSNGPWAPPAGDEASIQSLAAPAPPQARTKDPLALRLAVLSVPDVSARLLVDDLDDRGISADRVVSLWHAAAMAWDPAAPGAPGQRHAGDDRVVDSGAPATAVVLVDPKGRLVWSWSRGADLLAAGSMRLHRTEDESASVGVTRANLSRLAAEWLGWSAQLGAAPARVVVVTPRTHEGDGLTPAELGQALGELWPGASVDLAVHEDPVLATLVRLARMDAPPAQGASDRRQSLVTLSGRPGRAHRSMYRWASGAILAGALAMGVVAWRSWSSAGAARERLETLRTTVADRVLPLLPANDAVGRELARSQPAESLRTLVERRRQELSPKDLDVAMPIMQELSTLTTVLGTDIVEIKDLQLTPLNCILELRVPDLATADLVFDSIGKVEGTHCDWQRGSTTRMASTPPGGPDSIAMTLMGTWKKTTGGAH